MQFAITLFKLTQPPTKSQYPVFVNATISIGHFNRWMITTRTFSKEGYLTKDFSTLEEMVEEIGHCFGFKLFISEAEAKKWYANLKIDCETNKWNVYCEWKKHLKQLEEK